MRGYKEWVPPCGVLADATARSKMQQTTWVPKNHPVRVAKGALALAVLSATHRLLI